MLGVLTVLVALSCTSVLEREGWKRNVHHALSATLREGAQSPETAYAVFDCDYTSIIHDVEHTLVTYLVEHLAFADAPVHGFLDGVEDTSVLLEGWDMTAAEAGVILSEEFDRLKQLRISGMSLEELHTLPLYLEFRARFVSFKAALAKHLDYGTSCLWYPSLLAGMTWAAADSVIGASLRSALSTPVSEEEWVSPDGKFRGVAEKGIVVPVNMRNLYGALQRQGVDAYIVSASLERIVEALACHPEMGFGLSPDHVFGLRLAEGETVNPAYLEGYPQPFKEGKVLCINAFIAPLYGGAGPLLVAGDSNGDVAMLTAWPSTKCSLIMDYGRKAGPIADLAAQARASRGRSRYVAQPVVL